MSFDPWLGPAVVAAGIAALVNLLGLIVTGRRLRGQERRRRLEREDDLRIALAAEVAAHVELLRLFDLDEQWRRIVGRMEAEPDYAPFVPSERNDTVFRALVAEIQVLPEGAIEPVVRYYGQLHAIEAVVGDLRSEVFRAMDQAERIAMYTDYIALKKEALARGEAAIDALRPSAARSVPGG